MARAFTPVVQVRRPAPSSANRTARAPAPATRSAGASAGVPRFAAPATGAPSTPLLSQRTDRWETEASRVAEAAVRVPVTAAPAATAPSTRTRPPAAPPGDAAPPDAGGGTPLPAPLRRQVESVTGADLGHVRIHAGPTAAHAAAAYGARAFTVGSHIYLGGAASSSDSRLLAHEAAHTVQQTALLNSAPARAPPTHGRAHRPRGPPPAASSRSTALAASALEPDRAPAAIAPSLSPAPAASTAPSTPALVPLSPAPVGMVQRDEAATPEEPGLLERGFWAILSEFVSAETYNTLYEIRSIGFWQFLKNKISDGLASIFAGMRAQGGFTAGLADTFQNLIDRGRVILAALVSGDCQPLIAAVRDFRDTLSEIAGDAWASITEFLTPIGDYLSGLWEKFGAPVVDFLGEFASDAWTYITELGQSLWEWTAPARNYASSVWTEVKNLLGFGEGSDDDGSEGLVGWITRKAGEVWDEVKLVLEPVLTPINAVVEKITAFLPLEAILNLRDTVTTWMDNAMQMADNMEEEGDVAENQDLLRDIVLPGIRRAIAGVQDNLTSASTWVTGLVGELVGEVTGFFTALGENTLLSPLSGQLQWLSEEATALGQWATEKVVGVFDLAHEALTTLGTWIEPVLNALSRLVATLGDLMGRIGDFVLGPFLLIPECIREPIKNFLVEQILSRIPIFSQLLEVPGLWARAQTVFRRIVVMIFRDGNLAGAAWTFFREVLQLFGLPPTLVTNLIRNAARAIRDILRDPVGFLVNLLNAVKTGFLQFFDNFGTHLLNGIATWLFSALGDTGIRVPTEFSLRAVVDVVLQVLDITRERIFAAITRRVGPERAAQIQRGLGIAGEALGLVQTLITQGPGGLWNEILSRLNNLWESIVSGVMDFLITRVVAFATRWLVGLLDISGIMPVINSLIAIYNAIQSFFQYLRQMMEILNSVFEGLGEIARGVITRGANLVEQNLGRMVPIAIGFLANQIGMGDLPQQIRRIVGGIRARVDRALDWIVDRIVRAVNAVVGAARSAAGAVRSGIDAVLNWWRAREDVPAADGTTHHVYLDGPQDNPRLMVASAPMDADAAITAINAAQGLSAAEKTTAVSQATAAKTGITAAVNQLKILNPAATAGNMPTSRADRTDAMREQNRIMREHLRTLAEILGRSLFAGVSWNDIPDTVITPTSGGRATTVTADKLTAKGPAGTTPQQDPVGWEQLQEMNLTDDSVYRYKRLHLVNENFGGLGNTFNLTPGSQRNNTDHLGQVETPIKRLIGDHRGDTTKRAVLWYTLTVNYRPSGGDTQWPVRFRGRSGRAVSLRGTISSADFPENIRMSWGQYRRENNAWVKDPAALGNFTLGPIPLPPFHTATPVP
jgi:phage-related protein